MDKNQPHVMDSLTSMNIVPFMGLLSLLEAKYLHIPEVFNTLIAILCDFNPLLQDNVCKTKRYLRALLSREPELLQCLLTFLDEPQFATDPMGTSADSTDSNTPSGPTVNVDGQSSVGRSDTQLPLTSQTPSPAQQVLPEATSPPGSGNVCPASETAPEAAAVDAMGLDSVHRSNVQMGTSLDMNCDTQPVEHQSHAAVSSNRNADSTKMSLPVRTAAPTNDSSGPCFPGVTARLDQLYVMRPHLVPLVNLQTGSILGTEPWAVTAPCPHQRLTLNACLVPAHFLSSSCMMVPPGLAASSTLSGGDVGAAISTSTQGTSLAHLAPSVAMGTGMSASLSPADVPVQKQESQILQTTVGTNTPVTRKPSLRGTGDSKGNRSKSAGATVSRVSATPSSATMSTSASTSFTMSMTPSTFSKSCVTTGLSLSQLLGQPSVAPPGSYLDKRNCIMGTSNLLTPCGQKRSVIITTPTGRPTDVKQTVKSSHASCTLQKEPSKAAAFQALPKPTNTKPIAAVATRPLPSASSASKVLPILHSSEVFTSSCTATSKSQTSSLTSEGKTHTVHVSLGSTQSLAAFPYIQEMVLPDPQAGTVALKLQTAGVEVTTSAAIPRTYSQPATTAKLLGSVMASSPALEHKPMSGGATGADCAAKLQSLARASVHAKQMPEFSGPSSAASFQVSPQTTGATMADIHGLAPLSESQNSNVASADIGKPTACWQNTVAPLTGPNTGRVKIKRKRSASNGCSSPFNKPVAKQRNKENS